MAACTGLFLQCFDALSHAYLSAVAWEPAAALEARAARLLPALMLARIDGKSPVEYIDNDANRNRVRRVAGRFIAADSVRLDGLKLAWLEELSS